MSIPRAHLTRSLDRKTASFYQMRLQRRRSKRVDVKAAKNVIRAAMRVYARLGRRKSTGRIRVIVMEFLEGRSRKMMEREWKGTGQRARDARERRRKVRESERRWSSGKNTENETGCVDDQGRGASFEPTPSIGKLDEPPKQDEDLPDGDKCNNKDSTVRNWINNTAPSALHSDQLECPRLATEEEVRLTLDEVIEEMYEAEEAGMVVERGVLASEEDGVVDGDEDEEGDDDDNDEEDDGEDDDNDNGEDDDDSSVTFGR